MFILALLACGADPSALPYAPTPTGLDDVPGQGDLVAAAGPIPTFTGPDELSGSDGYACFVASAGDVNADGYDDVLIVDCAAYTVAVHHGSAAGISMTASRTLSGSAADNFGISVGGGGDLNGDGYDDIVVGMPDRAATRGCVRVWYGAAAGIPAAPGNTVCGFPGTNLGGNVDIVGDVNGDGYDDLAASSAEGGIPSMRVYRGGPTGISATAFWGAQLGTGYDSPTGQSLRPAGDVNADGYADVIVGGPNSNSGGGAFRVYYGSATGIHNTIYFETTSSSVLGTIGGMGWSVSTAGDVDGDGYDDVVVGIPWVPYNGFAATYFGSPSGLSASDQHTWVGDIGDDAYNGFGTSVIGGANFNGDGYSDIVVSDWARWNGGYGIPAGSWGSSQIYVGDPNFLSSCTYCGRNPDTLLLGKGASGGVVDLGDVNGDGCSDLIESESYDWGKLGPFMYEANIWYGSC